MYSHTESAGECPRCKSEDYWLTTEHQLVLNIPIVGIWYHCNRCGDETLEIVVGEPPARYQTRVPISKIPK